MKLIVGLGNPGAKYILTRHNLGFMVIDGLAMQSGISPDQFKSEKKALTTKVRLADELVLLAKPQTFMNLSGESVQSLMSYYDIELNELLVIHDEVDFPFQIMKFQSARGHGGHNGIRSTHQMLSSNEYDRLKMGVGRPPGRQEVADYLLSNFSKTELDLVPDFISRGCDGVESWVQQGLKKTANEFNSKTKDT